LAKRNGVERRYLRRSNWIVTCEGLKLVSLRRSWIQGLPVLGELS
jgi:hypothetical protein